MMAAYNFQKRFAPAIRSGAKRGTIRARRKNGYVPKVGEMISLYTGMRSIACELLRHVKVKAITPIVVNTTDGDFDGVVLDGVVLGREAALKLAKDDGFESLADMAAFFSEAHGDSFSGYLIQW